MKKVLMLAVVFLVFLSNLSFSQKIDVFLGIGQSNMSGIVFGGSVPPKLNLDTINMLQYDSIKLKGCNDPVGNAVNNSAWPTFAQTYYRLSGNSVCVVPSAFSGASMTCAAMDVASWDTCSYLFDTSVARLNRAVIALTNMGYTPIIRGIICGQGEQDAQFINSGGITKAAYIAAFQKLIRRYRALYPEIPFFIAQTGTRVGSNDAGSDTIRVAQVAICKADLLNYLVFTQAASYPSLGFMSDLVHYNKAGYDEMGKTIAQNIIAARNGGVQTIASIDNSRIDAAIKTGYLGIGNTLPEYPLDIISSSRPSYREPFARFKTSDAPNDLGIIYNGTSVNGTSVMSIAGITNSSSAAPCFLFNGYTSSTNDVGQSPLFLFTGIQTNNPTDPINGVGSKVLVRPIAQFRNALDTLITVDKDGRLGVGISTPDNSIQIKGTFGINSSIQTSSTISIASINSSLIDFTSTSTATMPATNIYTARQYDFINSSNGNITINANASNDIWYLGTLYSTLTIASGESYKVVLSNGKWKFLKYACCTSSSFVKVE